MIKQLRSMAVLGGLALVLVTSGYATVLAPGTCAGSGCVPAVFSDFPTAGMVPYVIVADTGVEAFTAKDVFGNTKITGNFRQIVISDSVTGFLDFLYQVQRTGGPDSIGRLTTIDYTPTIDDVGICSACSPAGDLLAAVGPLHIAPMFVARSPGGDQITFDFGGTSTSQIGDSNESSVLVIKTNAKNFVAGSSSIIDGGTANVSSFAPTPEPALAGLMLGVLFGAGLFVARRFQVV